MDRAMRSLEQARARYEEEKHKANAKRKKGGEPPQVYDGRHYCEIFSGLLPV